MGNAAEAQERLAATLEKYRKNKTLVPPEDLAGKYKVPFMALVKQLQEEIEEYLKAYSLEGLQVANDEHLNEFVEAANQIFSDPEMRRQAGKAAFKEYDMSKIKQIAEQLKRRLYHEVWLPYFMRHTCLYATESCFAEDNPQTPRIYNSLVDKFWDDKKDMWIADPAGKAPALLIYIQDKETEKRSAVQ